MIKNGTDVNARDGYEMTPLMRASSAGHLEVVRILLKAGADPNLRDFYGNTALLMASGPAAQPGLQTAVRGMNLYNRYRRAFFRNQKQKLTPQGYPLVVRELIKANAQVDTRDNMEETALMRASRLGYPDVVRDLINAGANIDARNKNNETARMLAQGRDDIIHILDTAPKERQIDFGRNSHLLSRIVKEQRRKKGLPVGGREQARTEGTGGGGAKQQNKSAVVEHVITSLNKDLYTELFVLLGGAPHSDKFAQRFGSRKVQEEKRIFQFRDVTEMAIV